MIVTQLKGGLGNQLFQYAAARALVEKNGTPVFLDLSFLNQEQNGEYTQRHFELDQFKLDYKIADNSMLQSFKRSDSVLSKLFGKTKSSEHITFTEDNYTHKEPLPANIYLDGFWQSEKYFSEIRAVLLKEIVPNYNLGEEYREFVNQVKGPDSVGLHVRRGDYVHLKSANAFHGVCGIDYFKNAINFIRNKNKEATFFIFSDDMAWCEENFKNIPNIVFMKTPGSPSSLDLFLMSYCEHNIISNSSYSWWAAWLNQHEHKIVIAPENWYADKNRSAESIYGKNWIRL